MSKLGADDFSGYPKKSTEKNDQATGTGVTSDFGKCTVENGKAVLNNDIISQTGGLNRNRFGTIGGPSLDASDDATNRDGHGKQEALVESDVKTSTQQPSGASAPPINTSGDMDEDDVK